jgi:NADH-quinone oxidoreductase subunit G
MAVNAVSEILKTSVGSVGLVGSGRSSLEEQFLAKKLATALGATTHLVSHVAEGDKILISADRTPNVRGALVTGLATQLPTQKLTALAAAIDAGKVKVVVSFGEDLLAAGLTAAQVAKVAVIYVGTHANPTSAIARVVLPGATVFEKSGTFVNQQFRIQKFQKAVPSLAGTTDDLVVLSKLIGAAGGAAQPTEVNALWKVIATEISALGTMTFANIPETGLLLDGTPWAALPFVEGETLHFKGPARAENPEASKPSTPVNS